MSKVALVVSDFGPNRSEAITLLRRSFGMPLSSIQSAVAQGRPLFERQLFDRREPAFPDVLLEAMRKLEHFGASFRAHELLDGQSFSPDGSYYQITPDRLERIVESHRAGLAETHKAGWD